MPEAGKWRFELGIVLIVLLMSLGFAWLWQDIGFFDETIYLAQAAMLSPEWLLNGLEKAPLYAGWYKLLSWFCPDPLQRYFLSWALLVGVTLLLPLLFRLQGAWLYALALACLPIFRIWPYVSLPVAIILLIGLLLVLRHRLSSRAAITMVLMACVLAAYVRSEYAYGVFCACGAYAVSLIFTGNRTGRARQLLLLTLLLGVSIGMAHVQRLSDTGRSGVAFAQHVNLRAFERGELAANPWTSDHALREFGLGAGQNAATVSSGLGSFLRADPQRFAHHLLLNLLDPRAWLLTATVLLLTLWPWLRPGHRELRSASLYVGLASLPTLAATVLIYPRLHYAVSVLPMLVVMAILLLRPQRLFKLAHAPWLLLAIAPVMLMIAVGPRWLTTGQWQVQRPGIVTVQCMRSLERGMTTGPKRMLDALGYSQTYLAGEWRWQSDLGLQDRVALDQWLHAERPEWVVSTPSLSQRLGFTPAEFLAFMSARGYRAQACPAPSEATVHVRD